MADPGTDHQDYSNFAVWLSGRMHKLRLSQSELARKLGVSQPLISKWMRGTGLPSRETAERLAEHLDTPINEVLIQAGILPRTIHLGISAKHTHLHDIIDDVPDGMIDSLISLVEAIIRETR